MRALSKHVRKLPATLRRSLTWDRGLEMAKHKDFTVATDVKVYFCDPQSPWQRGSNENTNGLLQQYFPKNTNLTDYSQSDLNKVALRLNQRPRQTLGFQTPASKLQESVASTHRDHPRNRKLEIHMSGLGVISNDADRFKRFCSYFFCLRTHFSRGTRIASLGPYCFSLASPQPARAGSASSIRCCPPNISSVTIDHDELCELPGGRRVA